MRALSWAPQSESNSLGQLNALGRLRAAAFEFEKRELQILAESVDMIEMAACRDFRNNAAIRPMFFELRKDDVRQDFPVAGNDGGRGFVAGCFDAEDQHSFDLLLPGV